MKANKKVIDSFLVTFLAMVLTITAVAGNINFTNKKNHDVSTGLQEGNGIAGVTVATNEYCMEAADELDEYISVEKEENVLVAASAEDVTVESSKSSVISDSETEDKTAREWDDKLMAKVNDFLYVRAKADPNSKIVGKMYKGDRALIKKEGGTWTKIASGNVKGYVKSAYCVIGADAYKYAKKTCKTVARATIDGLRIRKKPSTDAKVIKAVTTGETFVVNKKAHVKKGWVAVKVDSETCYVSEEYVETGLKTGKAVTIEEEKAALQAAKAAEEAKQQANTVDRQNTASGVSQNGGILATVDEETLLAALVQCEAGGESVQCMTAVGAVVVNRVHSSLYPGSIRDVIYQSHQFGPVSSGRLASRLRSGVSPSARQAARAALNGNDPTGGAMYFKLASSGHAGIVIDAIVFY